MTAWGRGWRQAYPCSGLIAPVAAVFPTIYTPRVYIGIDIISGASSWTLSPAPSVASSIN